MSNCNTKSALLELYPALPGKTIPDNKNHDFYAEIARRFGAKHDGINEKIDSLIETIDPFEEYADEEEGVEFEGRPTEFMRIKRKKFRDEIQRFHDAGLFATQEGRLELIESIGFAARNELTTFESEVLTRLLLMAESSFFLDGTTVTAFRSRSAVMNE